MKIALTGDVMLGRMVDQSVIQNRSVRPEALWGDVLPIMLAADCRLINLECVISSQGEEWHPATKAFHFRAHPRALEFLRAARIDGVTLANNHVLDFGTDALLECLALLDRAGIKRTGAGPTLQDALNPALFGLPQYRIAVVALTDNEPDWEAAGTRPGVNYVDLSRPRVGGALPVAHGQGAVLGQTASGPGDCQRSCGSQLGGAVTSDSGAGPRSPRHGGGFLLGPFQPYSAGNRTL